jgi:hypothetical protein
MSLLQDLIALGDELPPADRPTNDQIGSAVAALIYREDTGGLEPPAPASDVPSGSTDPRDAEIDQLREELAAAESKSSTKKT